MKKIKILIALNLFLLFGCNNEDSKNNIVAALCDSSNTNFNQLYNTVVATNSDAIGFAHEVHSYTFEVLSNKTICEIGYQSLPSMSSVPYLIEIIDNTLSTTLYSGSNVFSSSSTSYISITPISLIVGHSYSINRIQTNWGESIFNTEGRVVSNSTGTLNFPVISGALKITGSASYNVSSPTQDNQEIPYIDIVFES